MFCDIVFAKPYQKQENQHFMDAQITENKLIELFIDIDDLHIAWTEYRKKIGDPLKGAARKPGLNGPEVCTILVGYHLSGYKCFEYYYRRAVLGTYADCFPRAPSYKHFLGLVPRAAELAYLWLLFTMMRSQRTGLYFVDSKKLQVCHLERERSNKVFKGVARKGKTSTGWFFGLKIHLVINNLGEIVAFSLTPGNVADNNHGLLLQLLGPLEGLCVGDRGYHTALFAHFYENGLHLLTRPKKNMKKLPVDNRFNRLINKRAVVESVFDILGTVCDIEHSRHRSPLNASVHILSSLIAYQYIEHKPRVFFPSRLQQVRVAA